jgi:ABC-type molybdate transport system substrate-binding protein
MKFFSMKKPAVRILLLVVLLGLAIFYFRYMREGFRYVGEASVFLDVPSGDTSSGTTDITVTNATTLTAALSSLVAGFQAASQNTVLEGTPCGGAGTKKDKYNNTLYCCSSIWSKTQCPSS